MQLILNILCCSPTKLRAQTAVLNYEATQHKGTLLKNIETTTVQSIIPYTQGNGGIYTEQNIHSTGIKGLTATLPAGKLANGKGKLIYTIKGIPTTTGTAYFNISLGRQNIVLTRTIYQCGAYVAKEVFNIFMCHNLGANTELNPNTNVQGIHGNYYQWGRKNEVATANTQATNIPNWQKNYLANNIWNASIKTKNDPCPSGFRIPTKTEWEAIRSSNTISRSGSWLQDNSNYSSTLHFGPDKYTQTLSLPAAGYRSRISGSLSSTGINGNYWSSTISETKGFAYFLGFDNKTSYVGYRHRANGFSVRCIEE